MGIGERLKEERGRIGLNQTEFAAMAGVQKNAQSNYEKGDRNPDASYLEAIASAGVDVTYVITGVRTPILPASLSPRAARVLSNFELLAEEDKAAIERLIDSILQSQINSK